MILNMKLIQPLYTFLFNYDYIPKENEKYLFNYKYTGVDKSYLYNYIFSPVANFCMRFVPLNIA